MCKQLTGLGMMSRRAPGQEGLGGDKGEGMTPKYVPILIPGTYEYIALKGKRDFADVIHGSSCEAEMILDYLAGLGVVTRVLISDSGAGKSVREADRRMEGVRSQGMQATSRSSQKR